MKRIRLLILILFIFLISFNYADVYAISDCNWYSSSSSCSLSPYIIDINVNHVATFEKNSTYNGVYIDSRPIQGITTTSDSIIFTLQGDVSGIYDGHSSAAPIYRYSINTKKLEIKTPYVKNDSDKAGIFIGHANDLAYNDKEKILLISHKDSTQTNNYMSIVNTNNSVWNKLVPSNLTTGDIKTKRYYAGLAYSGYSNIYYGIRHVSGVSRITKLSITKSGNTYNVIEDAEKSSDVAINLTPQGGGYHNGLVYFGLYESGSPGTTFQASYSSAMKWHNLIAVYDTNGKLQYIYHLNNILGELESVSFIGNKMYIGVNSCKNGTRNTKYLSIYSYDLPKDQISIAIPKCSTKVYNGSSQKIISSGEGYSFSNYIEPTDVGTYIIYAKLKSGYIWNDNTTEDKVITCRIEPLDISKSTVTNIEDKTYTGSKITQNPIVKITIANNEKTLSKNVDYDISYINNIEVGKATLRIVGKGNYTGTKDISFNINPVKEDKKDEEIVKDEEKTKDDEKIKDEEKIKEDDEIEDVVIHDDSKDDNEEVITQKDENDNSNKILIMNTIIITIIVAIIILCIYLRRKFKRL